MPTENNYRSRLEKLAGAAPSTKAALIRSLLPGIEVALNSGQRLKDIWKELNDEGLEMSYQGFHKTVQRARRSRKLTATSGWGKQAKSPEAQGLQETKVETAEEEDLVAGIEAAFLSAQAEALGSIEKAARKAGMAVREEIQKDVETGQLHARELIVELNSAYSRSAVRRWVAVGLVVAGGLLLLGVGLGVQLARVWK